MNLPPPPAPVDDPVVAAPLAALCAATTARTGWVVALDGDVLRVVAARGRGRIVPAASW